MRHAHPSVGLLKHGKMFSLPCRTTLRHPVQLISVLWPEREVYALIGCGNQAQIDTGFAGDDCIHDQRKLGTHGHA